MNFMIWSKDRACQLHLLLESIVKHCKECKSINISILWKASNKEFKSGYFHLFDKFKDTFQHIYINIFNEDDSYLSFQDKSLFLLEGYDKVCLLTDDTVFYDDIDFSLILDKFISNNSIMSLRLGQNTIVQDHINNTYQRPLKYYFYTDSIIGWNPNEYNGYENYGYPFAIDAHIYDTKFLLKLMSSFRWNNTNELEGGLQKFTNKIETIYSFLLSKAVNIPYNNISGLTLVNPTNSYSLESMNRSYLARNYIDLEAIENTKIIGCHQDVILKWR